MSVAESSTLPASAPYSSECRPNLVPLARPRTSESTLLRLYYALKPYLPFRLRLAARRIHAASIRRRTLDTWPIYEPASRRPAGWTGWPDGKQFAFVLTHDVESHRGLERVKPLAELEMEMGFRSAFYFIPEGPYEVPKQLRHWLMDHGFEVGVHDLHHDGKLFSSYDHFRVRVERINHYLAAWDAVGFRSGFMLHNLDWIGELDIKYDTSTFDTDPFEPQPEGVGTIFPFWVAKNGTSGTQGRGRGGYVELPYTLCQDSTMFLLLQERSPVIWERKLDWLAQSGGMVLINTHPDYMNLGRIGPGSWQYPAAMYGQLMKYAKERYAGAFWHGTAGELTAWYKSTLREERPMQGPRGEASPRVAELACGSGRRICMVSYSAYENDNRVSRYCRELARRGDSVEVFSLKTSPKQEAVGEVDGVRVHRLLFREKDRQKSRLDFLLPVLRFLFSTSVRIAWNHCRKPYDLLHVHNVPDFLVFVALVPRLTGAKVILDIHDILPEFYASKFGMPEGNAGVKLLKWVERVSARVANHVILSNDLWREKYAARTRRACSSFINNVDSRVFHPRPRTRTDDRLVVIYPGGLQSHQGLDIAIRAFAKVSVELPRAEFHIFGEGSAKGELVVLTRDLGLEKRVLFFDVRPAREIVDVIANADLGVVPKRADSFGNEAYSTKIMEFMAMGVPVVASETKIDRFYFNDNVVRFFPSGDADALARAMIEVLTNKVVREELRAHATRYAEENSWGRRSLDYLALVDSLTVPGPEPALRKNATVPK